MLFCMPKFRGILTETETDDIDQGQDLEKGMITVALECPIHDMIAFTGSIFDHGSVVYVRVKLHISLLRSS